MKAKFKRALAIFSKIISQVIIFEIVFMTSPLALYFYLAYRPGLNFLNSNPFTSWLTSFFLPHYSHSSIPLFNVIHELGYWIFLPGLAVLIASFIPLYISKIRKTGIVTDGIYRFVRHPQYTAFTLMGFGVLLVWPRTIVFLLYALMLFSYVQLSNREEKECLEKFGDSYSSYKKRTSRFIPGDKILEKYLVRFSFKRPIEKFYAILILLVFSIVVPEILKEISVRSLSTYFNDHMATISLTEMDNDYIRELTEIAFTSQEVGKVLIDSGYDEGTVFLNYVFPSGWNVPDLPFSFPLEEPHDHYQPSEKNTTHYRMLFTKALYHSTKPLSGINIIKHSYARKSLLVVDLDINKRTVEVVPDVSLESLWGNIPTPLF